MTYIEITNYFGTKLSDPGFQTFLESISCDPAKYNSAKSEYISSKTLGLEIGFRNDYAIYDEDEQKEIKKGIPVFSLLNLHAPAEKLIQQMPFGLTFSDTKKTVLEKAGHPIKSVDFVDQIFGKRFLIDHFNLGNFEISVDYDKNETVERIQIRDKNQVDIHLK